MDEQTFKNIIYSNYVDDRAPWVWQAHEYLDLYRSYYGATSGFWPYRCEH